MGQYLETRPRHSGYVATSYPLDVIRLLRGYPTPLQRVDVTPSETCRPGRFKPEQSDRDPIHMSEHTGQDGRASHGPDYANSPSTCGLKWLATDLDALPADLRDALGSV